MSPDERKEIRELCERATEGPWIVKLGRATFGDGTQVAYVMQDAPDPVAVIAYEVGLPEAAFIARSRTLLPRLLDELEALEKELTSYRETEGTNAICFEKVVADRDTAAEHEGGE